MKVALGTVDEAGCGHYRIKYPGQAAALGGVDVEFVGDLLLDINLTGKVVDVVAPECDVFVFQRPLKLQTLQVIELLKAKGIAVVVDVDDDFTCIDPRHMGYRHYQPRTSPKSNRDHLGRAVQLADLVTVTTPALARRYGAHGRVRILPNFVPEKLTRVERFTHDPRLTIGWPGLVGSHPGDLQAACGGVAAAVRELRSSDPRGARFLNIGTGSDVAELLGLGKEEIEVSGAVEFDDYPAAVAQLDVGIVPLADTKFNEAKSRLKGLEMAALGVPFVASALPEYVDLAAAGIGEVTKPRYQSWYKAIKDLATPEAAEQAVEARQIVARDFTYEGNLELWIDAWTEARERAAR